MTAPKDAFPWREGVVPVEVDGELLVLDSASGRVVRLSGPAKAAVEGRRSVRSAGLPSDTPGVVDVLAGLGLTQERVSDADRRAVLRAGALAALGISVMALPSAAAHATGGGDGGDGLFASGTGDETFTTSSSTLNGGLYAVRAQSDGRIVIGGSFTSVGGTTRQKLARLNADGTLDTTFADPALGGGSGWIEDLDLDADGSVVVGRSGGLGGSFKRFDPNGVQVAGFNPNAWNSGAIPPAPSPGWTVRIDSSTGAVYVGGNFDLIDGVARGRLARLHANGDLDTGFADPALNGIVEGIDLFGTKVVVGGGFSSTSGGAYRGVVRFHANGVVDDEFADPSLSGGSNPVRDLEVDGVGGVLVGGAFTSVGGSGTYQKIARLHPNGQVDTSFVAPALSGSNADVIRVATQSDGRVVIGGRFTSVGGESRGYIARLEANGALEGDFNPNANGQIWGLDLDSSGRIIAGGFFTNVGGLDRTYIARID